MNLLSTQELTSLIETFMAESFDNLIQEYLIFTIAALAAVLPILLALFVRHRHKAYIYRDTTPMTFHNLMVLWLPLSAIKNLWDIYRRSSDFSGTNIEQYLECTVSIVLLIIAVFVSIQLLRRKLSGPLGTFMYIWLFTAFKNYRGITLGFWKIPSLLTMGDTAYSQRPIPEQIMCYMVSDYYVTLAMTITFLALVLTAVLGVYFYHRRYVFLPDMLDRFPKCSHCGKPILRGDCHCGNCGTAVAVNPLTNPVNIPLDKDHTCKECGTPLLDGICVTCELQGKKRTKKEKRSDFLKRTGKMILVMLLVYTVYYFVIDSPKILAYRNILPANMVEYSQEFSTQYNRLTKDITLVKDETWQNDFYAACETLYAADSRWAYSCNPRTARSNDWVFYGAFGTASFEQMKVLEQIKEQIKLFIASNREAGPIPEETTGKFWSVMNPLIIQLSNTIDAQENAMAEYERHSYNYLPIERQEIDLFDGFRFYMQFINVRVVATALLIIAFCAATYVLNFFCIKSALKMEVQYVTRQAKNEEKIQNCALRYMEIPELESNISRSRQIFCSTLPHITRAAGELWTFFTAIITGIIVFLSLFRWQNIRRVMNWVWGAIKTRSSTSSQPTYDSYKKMKRKSLRKTIFWLCFFITVIHVWTITHPAKQNPVEQFMDLSGNVYWDNGPKINAYLITIGNSGAMPSGDAQSLLVLIDDELTRIQALQGMNSEMLQKKIDKKYPGYWSGVFSLSQMEETLLLDFQAQITTGVIPSAEAIARYTKLGTDDFAWVYDIYYKYQTKKINGELNNIADTWNE